MQDQTKSPVYQAVAKILDLFDLNDKIALLSYRDAFAKLWDLEPHTDDMHKPIWCVVDDSFGQFHWLQVGVWGHYYRAKHGSDAPKLLLIGEDEALYPHPDRESLFVPDFYRKENGECKDDGLKVVPFWHKEMDFITLFSKATESLTELLRIIKNESDRKAAEKDFGPTEQMIVGWKGIIKETFSLPERRHRISNEIAPIELAKAILDMRITDQNKDIIDEFTRKFQIDREKEALLEVWKWVAGIKHSKVSVALENYIMKDVWNAWTNAKFLLIDDQGKSGYYDILRCALSLITGNRDVSLECRETVEDSEAYLNELIEKFDCLFLDLRLTKKDQSCGKYDEITGLRIARKLAERSSAFPIIIFSSSQQREITNILSGYGNIIETFRKPGIAGSVRAISGSEALRSLFSALQLAMEMIENSLVWKELAQVPDNIKFKLKGYNSKDLFMNGEFDNQDKRSLYKQVFWKKVYDKAFTYPYSYFENLINISLNMTNYQKKNNITFANRISFKSNTTDVTVPNSINDIACAFRENRITSENINTYIRNKNGHNPTLSDLTLEEWTPGFNLQLRILHQFRNLAAHRLHSFEDKRREAIAVLLIFVRTLRGSHTDLLAYNDLASDQYVEDHFQILHPCDGDINDYIKKLMRQACYFGGKALYREMYELCIASK